jgi:hypothetical protein
VGLIVLLGFYVFMLHRAMIDRAGFTLGDGRIAQA